MNPVTLRRIAIISAVLTALLALDGIYMLVSRYNNNETQNYHLPDGATVLIAAILLLILTVVAFVLSNRSQASISSTSVTNAITPATSSQDEPTVSVEPEVQG